VDVDSRSPLAVPARALAEPAIVARGLTRRFGKVFAVDHLDLEVRRGEVFGYLGHNGAGKTTTVRLLNGVLDRSEGDARVLGLDPSSDGPELRKRTGVLTETPALEERLTGYENLRIFAEIFGVPAAKVRSRVELLLGDFGLADRAGQKVSEYSRGMKQRLSLARCLLHEPEIVFLDEPTSGLDPVATHHVHELVVRFSREEGRTVFLCTHNLGEAERLCDRVAVLERGKLLATGAPRDLAERYAQRQELELEIDPATAGALSALGRVPGARVALGENGRVVVQGIGREATPEALALLVGAGLRIYQATPHIPSLEDVYFALHGEAFVEVER
jgi:ABC-2 type transport system ATP-binding protein